MSAAVAVSVRPAGSGDIDALSAAHLLGQAAVVDARGGPLDTLLRGRGNPVEPTFEADLAEAGTHVWVGTADDAFAGYCVLKIETLRNDERLGVVHDLWVHPSARGIGIGYALMRRATDTAIDAGCRGIDARALPGDRATKNFFESFGLVARAIEVHKSFDE